MYTTRNNSTANLNLIDKLSVSLDTSNVCGELCWLDLTGESGSLRIEAAIYETIYQIPT
jgi:hypothetical protein